MGSVSKCVDVAFDMVDDTLVFDAEASTDRVWYSGITDGSVFESGIIFTQDMFQKPREAIIRALRNLILPKKRILLKRICFLSLFRE